MVAVLAVVAAFAGGSWLVATLGAAVAAATGAGATKLTYSEVVDARRHGARDRAEQARAYVRITEARVAEQVVFAADMSGRIARHEATIGRLERRLVDAAREVSEAHQRLAVEQSRGADERDRLAARVAEAQSRAAAAEVRAAELERELEVVLAEWRSGVTPQQRKHA